MQYLILFRHCISPTSHPPDSASSLYSRNSYSMVGHKEIKEENINKQMKTIHTSTHVVICEQQSRFVDDIIEH